MSQQLETNKAYGTKIPPQIAVAPDWSRWGRDDEPGIVAAMRAIDERA